MYMTKPKQVKKISENTGKTFSVIMPSFTCRGWAYLRKLLYIKKIRFAHAAVLQASFGTKDRKEGMTAFVEKRKANWEHK